MKEIKDISLVRRGMTLCEELAPDLFRSGKVKVKVYEDDSGNIVTKVVEPREFLLCIDECKDN